jgi:hypothetical protein
MRIPEMNKVDWVAGLPLRHLPLRLELFKRLVDLLEDEV